VRAHQCMSAETSECVCVCVCISVCLWKNWQRHVIVCLSVCVHQRISVEQLAETSLVFIFCACASVYVCGRLAETCDCVCVCVHQRMSVEDWQRHLIVCVCVCLYS
jgi:hypothetical protein